MKGKSLKFDEIMELYEELFPDKKPCRSNLKLKVKKPEMVANRIREVIKLSEELIWKRPLKK
ncbi:MAG: hypothetical protein AB1797_11810 [bacterium]